MGSIFLTYWHWLILGVALFGVEMLAPSTYLLWPAISAIIVGVLSAAFPSLGVYGEISIFALLTVASTIVWANWFRPSTAPTDSPHLNRRALQYIGRKVVLREDFVDGSGHIVLDDTQWLATAVDGSNLTSGTRIEVVEADGVQLKVRQAEDPGGAYQGV